MSALRGLPYLAAVTVGTTFAAAALAKWRDPAGTARGLRALGLSHPWPLARILPAVEAAVAFGLVVAPAGVAPLAVALLVAFTVFLAQRLHAGVRAECHCFGARRTGLLSAADLARNTWLVGAAVVAATGTWPQWPSPAAVLVAVALAATASASTRWLRSRAERRTQGGASPQNEPG